MEPNNPPPSPLPLRGRGGSAFAWPAAVFPLSVLAFAGALRNGFVWDDWYYIARADGLAAGGLEWLLSSQRGSAWGPLSWASLALDRRLWGLEPFGFHLTNLLLHGANAVLVYAVVLRLLRLLVPAPPAGRLEKAAAFAALVFAWHPLRVEAVAWAMGRRDLLAGLFLLSSLLLYLRGLVGASVACFALAASSKATVVPLPAVLLLLDWYPLGRFKPGRVGALLLEKVPYLAVAAAASVAAVLAQTANQNLLSLADYGFGARLCQAVYGLGFYVAKTLVPLGLSILHPLEPARGALVAQSAASAALLAGLAFLLNRRGVGWRAQGALWGFYALMLLPVLGLAQNGPQIVAERYSYLACLGWAAAAGAWAAAAGPWGRRLAPVALAAAFVLTQTQLRHWRDDVSIWTEHVRLYPNSADGRVRLSQALSNAGAAPAAEAQARRALELAPDNPMALYGLAVALEAQGRGAEALAPLERHVEAGAEFAPAFRLLGWIHMAAGRPELAEPFLSRASSLEPGDAQARYLLGTLHVARGARESGLALLESAARLRPDEPRYRQALARAGGRQMVR